MRVQFWLNAMLTLGTPTIARDTEFLLPTTSARVHSSGDKRLPGEKQPISWPSYRGVELGRYSNWQNWLGIFANDGLAGWLGAYVLTSQSNLGIARVYPPAIAQGVKLFAFGPQFPDRTYTDDDSQYFELWGGLNKSFWPEDDLMLAPGATLSWSEQWYPVTGTDGMSYANAQAALNIRSINNKVSVGVAAPTAQRGTLVAKTNGRLALNAPLTISPGYGFATAWEPLPAEPSPLHVMLQWLDESNSVMAQTEADLIRR